MEELKPGYTYLPPEECPKCGFAPKSSLVFTCKCLCDPPIGALDKYYHLEWTCRYCGYRHKTMTKDEAERLNKGE